MAKKLQHADFCAQERNLEKIRLRLKKWGEEHDLHRLKWAVDKVQSAMDDIDEAKRDYNDKEGE